MARQAKKTIASMSVGALLKLRDDIGAALSRRSDGLKNELKAIGADYADVGRIAIYGKRGKKSLSGRKVAAKYRDKAGNTWAGRGAQPRWLTAAIKAGGKREDFLVGKPKAAASAKKTGRKVKRRSKK